MIFSIIDESTIASNAVANNASVVENNDATISTFMAPVVTSFIAPPVSYAKHFPNILKIEVFAGENFIRWQERIFDVLDMHVVAWVLTDPKTNDNVESWTHENKVCSHSILSTLSNELFDVFYSYKEAKEI